MRGLDYYTRTTFEFVAAPHSAALGAQDTVSAGGRYDYLVETIGGPPTPAVGFASGIERIVLSAGQGETAYEPSIDVFFVCEPDAPREQVLALMTALRARGRSCEMDYAGRSLKGQLTQAQRLGAEMIVIAAAGQATLRRSGKPDESIPYEKLEEELA